MANVDSSRAAVLITSDSEGIGRALAEQYTSDYVEREMPDLNVLVNSVGIRRRMLSGGSHRG